MNFGHRFFYPSFFVLLLPVAAVVLRMPLKGTLRRLIVIGLLGLALQGPSRAWSYISDYGYHLATTHVPIAKALSSVDAGPELHVATILDGGVIPYLSGATHLDGAGLCNPHIAHEGFDPKYILESRPDVIIHNSKSWESIIHPITPKLAEQPDFEHLYQRLPAVGRIRRPKNALERLFKRLDVIALWRPDPVVGGALLLYGRRDSPFLSRVTAALRQAASGSSVSPLTTHPTARDAHGTEQ